VDVSRVAPWLLASLLLLAGCSGSSGPSRSSGERGGTPATVDATAGQVITGEVRTPDARTPLVRGGEGLWRCETPGRVELRVSPDGLASLSLGGRLLAQVFGDRALINRSCTSEPDAALPPFRAARGIDGESALSCRVPRRVLVDLRDGDLTVREPGRGRFLLGAAVSTDHLEAGGFWSASCSLDRTAG
jgi:hypothetical protein